MRQGTGRPERAAGAARQRVHVEKGPRLVIAPARGRPTMDQDLRNPIAIQVAGGKPERLDRVRICPFAPKNSVLPRIERRLPQEPAVAARSSNGRPAFGL